MLVSFNGCKFVHTERSIHFESFNDECAIVKEAQDANLMCQESKLTRVNFQLSFFLSLLVSLKLEHYTRECEFRNFDKKKTHTQKKAKKKTQKKHKNLWLNFCLNKECPKLLCGLGIGHRRRQTISMRNSWGEREFFRASLYVWCLRY